MNPGGPRLFRPDSDTPRPLVTAEPLPIQMRRQVVETVVGPLTTFFVVWKAGATSCRFCTAEACTFTLASDGETGSCVMQRLGDKSSPFAPVP